MIYNKNEIVDDLDENIKDLNRIIKHNTFSYSVKILGQSKQRFNSRIKYYIEFENNMILLINKYKVINGEFSFPIKFSIGNNSTNIYSTIYRRYSGAKSRCNNPSDKDYINYGARNIKFLFIDIYEYYISLYNKDNFCDFLENPSLYNVDRIDNNLDYSKDNIRIVTSSENQRNKRNNFIYTIKDDNDVIIASGIKLDIEKYMSEIYHWHGHIDTYYKNNHLVMKKYRVFRSTPLE